MIHMENMQSLVYQVTRKMQFGARCGSNEQKRTDENLRDEISMENEPSFIQRKIIIAETLICM